NPSYANGKRLLDYVLSFGAGSGPPGGVRRPGRASDRSWRRPLPVTGTRGEDLRGRGETAYSVSRVRQCCTRRADVPEPTVPGGAGTPQGRCGARRTHCRGSWVREVSPSNKRLKVAGVYRPNRVVVYPPSCGSDSGRAHRAPSGKEGKAANLDKGGTGE